MRHAATTPPRKGVSSRIAGMVSLMTSAAPPPLVDVSRNTHVRTQRKARRLEPAAGGPPPAAEPTAADHPPPGAVQPPPGAEQPPPGAEHPPPGAEQPPSTAVRGSPAAAVVDIFRNGKPPKRRRPTVDGTGAASERAVFAQADFDTFDKLQPAKRERLYFVARLKPHVSPDSTVLDYLARIDLHKVDKLMALTRALNQEAGPPRKRPSDAVASDDEKPPDTKPPPPGTVFSFGRSPPVGPTSTPLPLTKNSDATLMFEFSSVAPVPEKNAPAEESEPREVPTPPPAAAVIQTEPGLLDFLSFVREKCFSLKQIAKMCSRAPSARLVLPCGVPHTLVCADSCCAHAPFWQLENYRYFAGLTVEFGNKLESSFNDYSALQPKRANQLREILKGDKLLRKIFLYNLLSSGGFREAVSGELSNYLRVGLRRRLVAAAQAQAAATAAAATTAAATTAAATAAAAEQGAKEEGEEQRATLIKSVGRLLALERKRRVLEERCNVGQKDYIAGRLERFRDAPNALRDVKEPATDGLDVFLARTHEALRTSFTNRLNEARSWRLQAPRVLLEVSSEERAAGPLTELDEDATTPKRACVLDGPQLGREARICIKSVLPTSVREMVNNSRHVAHQLFGGVCLAASAGAAAAADGGETSSRRASASSWLSQTPDRRLWLEQVKRLPVTPLRT